MNPEDLAKENMRLREILAAYIDDKKRPRQKCLTCPRCPPPFALREGRCLDCWYAAATGKTSTVEVADPF